MGLASILVRLGLDSTGYNTGLKRAESLTASWGRRISASVKGQLAAAFSVAAVTAATRSVVAWADSIQDLSDDLGISARTLQEWEYVSEGTRATLDDFTRAFQFLAKQNRDLSNDQVLAKFNQLAEAFRAGQLTLGDLQKQLGRGASVLSGPFSKGLKDSTAEAEKLNRFLSDEQVNNLARLSDGWSKATGYAKAYFAEALLGIADISKKLYLLNKSSVVGPGVIPGEYVRKGEMFKDAEGPKPYARSAEWVGPRLPPKEETEAEKAAVARNQWSTASLTSNQAIGAFVSAQPVMLTEMKEQTKILKDIKKATEETAENS